MSELEKGKVANELGGKEKKQNQSKKYRFRIKNRDFSTFNRGENSIFYYF